MSGLKWSRCVAVCALIAGLALAGCTARQTVTTRPKAALSPSQSYLSKPVTSGWLRTVGRSNGLVLVFECQQVFAHGKDLHYRFVVFNESPTVRSWDDALFVVHLKKIGRDVDQPIQQGNNAFMLTQDVVTIGDYPSRGIFPSRDFPGLTLRSGESTTHPQVWPGLGGTGRPSYLRALTPSFKGGANGRAALLVSAPQVTVRFE
jgi:hypothetical protein